MRGSVRYLERRRMKMTFGEWGLAKLVGHSARTFKKGLGIGRIIRKSNES